MPSVVAMRCRSLRAVAIVILLSFLATPGWAGFAEGVAAYQRGDYATALREFRPLAMQGGVGAQYHLGEMYYLGQGIPRNYHEARKWYGKAAERGYAAAQYNLAQMFRRGQGGSKNLVEAAKWFRKAAERGFAKAQTNLGKMYVAGGNGCSPGAQLCSEPYRSHARTRNRRSSRQHCCVFLVQHCGGEWEQDSEEVPN